MGMPTGPKVFLATPGACGLRPCARIHQKKPCATLTRSVERVTNTASAVITLLLQSSDRTSHGRVCWRDKGLAECFSAAGDFLRPQGAIPSGCYPFRGGLLPGARGALNKGNADEALVIFGHAGRVWAPALRPDLPKKGLLLHLPVRWGVQQIQQQL